MNTAKTFIITALSSLITVAVVLSGAHAKDVVGGRIISKDDGGGIVKTTVKSSSDVTAKAMSDLHNHVDKTALKTFAKSAVDNSVLAREREVKAGMVQLERTASIRLMEMMFMLKLAFARAF
jgi:hypothetical protein